MIGTITFPLLVLSLEDVLILSILLLFFISLSFIFLSILAIPWFLIFLIILIFIFQRFLFLSKFFVLQWIIITVVALILLFLVNAFKPTLKLFSIQTLLILVDKQLAVISKFQFLFLFIFTIHVWLLTQSPNQSEHSPQTHWNHLYHSEIDLEALAFLQQLTEVS